MSLKRKFEEDDNYDYNSVSVSNKKHTLDSDEEDSDDYEKDNLNDSDVEGEEEGVASIQDEVKITPFNMREELQEGHFDKEGHYHWNKDNDIRDNWLDNIDWVKIKEEKKVRSNNEEDSIDSNHDIYNEVKACEQLLKFMEPGETVQVTLRRLGKSTTKLSSVERLKRKKIGKEDEAAEKIIKFTEIVNEMLTRTGNMDIYQETYQQIKSKTNDSPTTSKKSIVSEHFDMYSADFLEKEKEYVNRGTCSDKEKKNDDIKWQFKWKQEDTELNGPYTTQQMLKWSNDNYFKGGVYVRQLGEDSTKFYASNRIDFDLYL